MTDAICAAASIAILVYSLLLTTRLSKRVAAPKYAVGQLVFYKMTDTDNNPVLRPFHIHQCKLFDNEWRYAGFVYTLDTCFNNTKITLEFFTTWLGVTEDIIVPMNKHDKIGPKFMPWETK